MTIYAGSDGRLYTDRDVCVRFELGEWSSCMWSVDEGWEVVENEARNLVWLVPADEDDLPDGIELRPTTEGFTVVDRRLE